MFLMICILLQRILVHAATTRVLLFEKIFENFYIDGPKLDPRKIHVVIPQVANTLYTSFVIVSNRARANPFMQTVLV